MKPGFRLRPAIVDLCQQTRSEARGYITDHDAHYFGEHDFEAWCNSLSDLQKAVDWVQRLLINTPGNHKQGRKFRFRLTTLEWSRGHDLWPVVELQWYISSNPWITQVLEVELKYEPVAGDK